MIRNDFKYHIAHNISGYTDCKNHGCEDEKICRCFKINSVNIELINIEYLSKLIYSDIYDTKSDQYYRDNKLNQILYDHNHTIDIYCINRILTIYKLYDKKSWVSSWSKGYYGDEVDRIYLNDELQSLIEVDINNLIQLSTLKEKIEFILLKEYNYLLESIINKQYKVETVNISDIIFKPHHNNLSNLDYYDDSNYTLIRGICLKDGDKWRIIDGHHRLSNTKMDKTKIISIYGN